MQLLQQQQQQQQQQYLAASQAQQQQQQQQQQNFPTAPYTVISGQEPYVGALIAGAPPPVVPQYYGVAPWVYPAGLLPQAPPQAAAPPPPRRPLTPSSAAAAAAAAQDTANNLAQTVSKLIISPLFQWDTRIRRMCLEINPIVATQFQLLPKYMYRARARACYAKSSRRISPVERFSIKIGRGD